MDLDGLDTSDKSWKKNSNKIPSKYGLSTNHQINDFWSIINNYEAADNSHKKPTRSAVFYYSRVFYQWAYFFIFIVGPLSMKAFYEYWFRQPKDISNEVVLVTGGGNGIGREMTYELVRRGARVAICGLSLDNTKETEKQANLIAKNDNACIAYKADVTDINALEELRVKIIRDFGKHVTILVNNAGVMIAMEMISMTPDDVKKVVDVNLLSQFWTIKTFLPDMCANNHGHIVTMSSTGSFVGFEYATAYCATKWGVRGMMEALRLELSNEKFSGIHLTCVNPYFTATRKYLTDFINTDISPMTPEYAAFHAIDAMARNYEIVTLPWYFYYLFMLSSLLSRSCMVYFQSNILNSHVRIGKLREYLKEHVEKSTKQS